VPVQAKTLEYAVTVDRGGRMTIPGGAQIAPPEGWSADHLLLAALVRCSIESLTYHARRAGHAVVAAGEGSGRVTKRPSDGRYAFVELQVRVDAELEPRARETAELVARAERDCFVGASLTVAPAYEWNLA
jgi:organic hydroperoxide reductase OsmC/OhrA